MRPRKLTDAPDKFLFTQDLMDWLDENKIRADPNTETEIFLDYHRAKWSRFKDWNAAWRNWMRRADRFTARRNGDGVGSNVRRGQRMTRQQFRGSWIAAGQPLERMEEAYQDYLRGS